MIRVIKESKKVYLQGAKKYVKKPIVVRAVKINDPFIVDTLEGQIRGKSGDYLVEGINGEICPVDKEIFQKTYELEGP